MGRARPKIGESVGQPHHDPVVGRGRFLVDAVAFAQPPSHGQRQRPVHPKPIRRVQDHPPIAQLVAEPLDQQGGVGRHDRGGGALLVQQPPQVVRRIFVETQSRTTAIECLAAQPGQLAREGAERGA